MGNAEAMKIFGVLGGPVHPTEWRLPDGGSITSPGVALRDWFAAHASDQDVEHHRELTLGTDGSTFWKRSREEARFAFADAMLAESRKVGAS
jgi:hypothetical protein